MNEIKEKDGLPIRNQRAILEISNKIYPIYDGINTVGRNPDAVINIKSITISQHHAIIVVIGEDKHFISDVKSSNGTFLNCNCLQPLNLYELHDKDLLRFGEIDAIYKISSNDTNIDESAASESMSQSFYTNNTQNVEINDFHEMNTEILDTNEDANFHDLPTQLECFNDEIVNVNDKDRNMNASPSSENIQAEALIFSESLNKNTEPTQPNINQAKINEAISPIMINDESNKTSVDREISSKEIDKIDEPISDSVTKESTIINEQLNQNIDESSNESLDLATMQKVTPTRHKLDDNFEESQQIKPVIKGNSFRRILDSEEIDEQPIIDSVTKETTIEQSNENIDESSNESLDLGKLQKVTPTQHKFDDNTERSQQIKPVIIGNSFRRISDSDSNLIKNDKKQTSSDDETDIEDDEKSTIQTENKNNTSNESDLIPATQNVNLQEPQASGIIDDSFEDSSFALEISDKVFESFDTNIDENQPTQRINITVVEKHKNDKIDELYLESTQKIQNNPDIINEQLQKIETNSDIINEEPVKDIDDSVDQLKNQSKDNSSDYDIFVLPETPKKSKRTKLNTDPKSSTSEDVEDELQNMFATQQENFTCSQLVNILADSPIKRNTIQINDNNNNNNTRKTLETQNTVIEKPVPITTVDQKVEQELETIFQSQQDLTCSQLVRILDEPKDVKNTATTIDNPVENCEKDSTKNSKEIQKESNTRTLRRKFSKLESDKEMEVSKSSSFDDAIIKSNKRRSLRKLSVNSNTDSQSSVVSISNESSSSTITVKDKEIPKRKLKKIAESDNKIETANRRITRSSHSSMDTSSSEEFFNTPKLRLSKRNKIMKNESNESINNSNMGEVLKRTPRKRGASTGDDSNIPIKIRLDQQNISNREASKGAQISVSESTNTSIQPSITNQKNKMSRRTRKNPNNSTLLLPVTVTVPKNEENLENTTRFTRAQSSKKQTIPTPDASSSPSLSSSSIKTKRTNKRGVRRLSANSRSLKNLEKIEQNEDETTQKNQNKRKKSNLQEDINQELNQSKIVDTPEKSQILRPKVVFTMMDDPGLGSIIKQLGGKVVDNVKTSTVLVTKHVKRSAKLLSAVGQGIPICSPQWLLESKEANQFLDPWDYILKDNEAEERWNFKLHESLERSNRKKLMENYTFQLFVNEAADVLKGAIEACGGKCVARYPLKNCNSNFIIVANPDNQSKYNRIIKQKPEIRVVAPEAIFDGTLRQELQFERHLLL